MPFLLLGFVCMAWAGFGLITGKGSIAVFTFALLSFKKINIPEPLLILAAGVAGLLLFKS